MSINTRLSEHRSWPPWPAVLAIVRQCALLPTKTVVAFATRRAARRTLRDLEQLNNRLIADIGLDREALAALMRGISKRS